MPSSLWILWTLKAKGGAPEGREVAPLIRNPLGGSIHWVPVDCSGVGRVTRSRAERKAASNLKKHRVSFGEASTIFDDPWFVTFLDEEHSMDEDRYITIGLSTRSRLLLIAHTDRGGQIRIISARKATSNERKFYEEGL